MAAKRTDATRILTRLWRDEKGGVAILFMFLAVGLFGFVALSIDTSLWYSAKRRMQTAVDAGARAGAYVISQTTHTPEEIRAKVEADIAKQGFSLAQATISVVPNTSDRSVEVSMTMPLSMNFANLILDRTPTATVRATAAAPATAPPCLTIVTGSSNGGLLGTGLLSSSYPSGLMLDGASRVTSPPCRVQVNSTDSRALELKDGYIEAARICVTGGKYGSGTSVAVETGCKALADPLAAWTPPPMPTTCDWGSKRTISGRTISITPETYCEGLEIDNSRVTLGPGIYYIKRGVLKLTNNSVLQGEGVAFLLGGDATITIDKSTIKLKAPRTGPMAGFVFATTRDAQPGVMHVFVNQSDVQYEGAIYLPLQAVRYDGQSSSANIPPFTTYIVRRLELVNRTNLKLDNDYAASDVPVVGMIGAGVVLTR